MRIVSVQDLGAIIRQRRKTLGLTQLQLAERCGVGTRFIGELEGGKNSAHLGKALLVVQEVGLQLEAGSTSVPQAVQSPDQDQDQALS
ncbi:MAG: helix-turn-helix domain-containing protein [Alphaproteobacteria bacterium]|nr:helix-turn-helix domain-containing protein [Alphaproteobacteria bacterium]